MLKWLVVVSADDIDGTEAMPTRSQSTSTPHCRLHYGACRCSLGPWLATDSSPFLSCLSLRPPAADMLPSVSLYSATVSP